MFSSSPHRFLFLLTSAPQSAQTPPVLAWPAAALKRGRKWQRAERAPRLFGRSRSCDTPTGSPPAAPHWRFKHRRGNLLLDQALNATIRSRDDGREFQYAMVISLSQIIQWWNKVGGHPLMYFRSSLTHMLRIHCSVQLRTGGFTKLRFSCNTGRVQELTRILVSLCCLAAYKPLKQTQKKISGKYSMMNNELGLSEL